MLCKIRFMCETFSWRCKMATWLQSYTHKQNTCITFSYAMHFTPFFQQYQKERGSLVLWFNSSRILHFWLFENSHGGRTQSERMNTPVVDESSRHQTAEAASGLLSWIWGRPIRNNSVALLGLRKKAFLLRNMVFRLFFFFPEHGKKRRPKALDVRAAALLFGLV